MHDPDQEGGLRADLPGIRVVEPGQALSRAGFAENHQVLEHLRARRKYIVGVVVVVVVVVVVGVVVCGCPCRRGAWWPWRATSCEQSIRGLQAGLAIITSALL